MRVKTFLSILILLVVCKITKAAKLNYPRVLLPIFQTKSINFTLEAIDKSCFKWTSSRQDLISIVPIYGDISGECSHQALVTVQTREKRRNTAIVFAEELSSGQTLRCDVIVDVIDKLNVRTTTRQLYLEEAPETFELHAFDSQGNEFSTLEGIEFNWAISAPNQGNSKIPPALRFLTFTDSPYHEVPKSLEEFETSGLKGYKVLLEGINTGTSKVTVSMPHKEYSQIALIEVHISVLANIIIEPSEAHILVGDTISFRILQLKLGKLQEITLNNQYFFEIEDIDVATIKGYSATGMRLGRTMVVLRDRNVAVDSDNTVDKPKGLSAQLTVAEPTKLGVSLLPHNNWITVQGEKHEIAFDLYTSDWQKITLGSRYAITSELDESAFYVKKRTKNGTRLSGETRTAGESEVFGSYKELTTQAQLQIFPSLQLEPQKVILPYDPNIIKTHKIQFVATGGDGNYVWYSGNPRLLQMNMLGEATTVIRDSKIKYTSNAEFQEGGTLLSAHANVKVSLQKNPKITRQADVYFLPPDRLEIKRYNFETALNDLVRLHVGIYAFVNNTHVPYSLCENVNLDLEFSSEIFEVENSSVTVEKAPETCQVLYLRSTELGTTQLRVSYLFQGKLMKDSVMLHVYEPLSIYSPAENEIVLPIGASRNIIYMYGPRRIFTMETTLKKAANFNSKVIRATEIKSESSSDVTAYRILCREIGTTIFRYRIHNALPAKNVEPYESEFETSVHCVRPRFLKLYAKQELRKTCPMEMRSSLLHVKSHDERFEIEIEVQDVDNRKLMNISSLFIDWKFSAGDQQFTNIPHERIAEVKMFEGIELPSRDVLVASLTEVAPNLRIKGSVLRYNEKVLAKNDVIAERVPFGIRNVKTDVITKPEIENEIRFMAVNNTLLPFDHISIFMSKSRRERVPLSQGSGQFNINLSEQGIIQVEYDAKEKQLLLTPLRLGHVRVELIDLCLTNEPAYLSVSVVGIGAIRAQAQDRVERTNTIEALVRLYDTNDNLMHIDSNNLNIYELSDTVYDVDIVSTKLDNQEYLAGGAIRYKISGNNVGETKIVFSSGTGDKQISSEPLTVQVFSPLRLYPRNSTLIVGSSIQIYHQGGPQPIVNIVYSVKNQKIASMTEFAIATAHKLGTTTITGKCIIKNPISGNDEVISEDTIELHVVTLRNIQIRTPLVRIRSGAVMPATIWGQPALSPLILGTLENILIEWSTERTDVIEIYNVFTDIGIEYGNTDMISMRVRALNPGKARIHAVVSLADGLKLSSTVEVVVFKTLELRSPKQITMDWILAAPRSTLQLKCNLDDVLYKTDKESSKGIVSVTPDGLVRTKDILGRELIIAKTVEQTLPIGIEVKNVQYILASLMPSIKLRQLEHKIPRGLNFVLKVSLHDNLGNEFSHNIEDVNGLKYDLATKDVVDVQIGNNLTVVLNLPRETSNMIAISLRDTTGVKHAEDYIKLSVAESHHIFPTKTIFSVGDIICFDSPLTLSSIWTSSNEQIISIDSQTGVARVHAVPYKMGEKIVVTHSDKESRAGGFIKYDVEVRDADVIQLLKSFDIFSGTGYRAHLVVRNHLQTDKFTNLIAQNVSKCTQQLESLPVHLFNCQLTSQQPLGVKLLKHYRVTPMFEFANGRYACQIDLVTNFNEVLGIVKTNDVHFELEASLPNGLSDMVSLKFVPGVKVTPDTLNAEELLEQELTLSGLDKVLQKVEVTSSNTDYVSVSEETVSHGLIKYKISFKRELPLDEQLFVEVHSPETHQHIQIPVIGSLTLTQKCSSRPFALSSVLFYKFVENIGVIITVLIVMGLTLFIYMSCFSFGTAREINADAFANSGYNNTSMSTVYNQTADRYSPSPKRSERYGSRNGYSSDPDSSSFVYGDPKLISPVGSAGRRYL